MLNRENVLYIADFCKSTASNGKERSKRGIVYFVTSDKVIQAVMTASAFAVVASVVDNVAYLVSTVANLPRPPIVLVSMVFVFYAAMWADDNTDEWREMVEKATGEEVADDEGGDNG